MPKRIPTLLLITAFVGLAVPARAEDAPETKAGAATPGDEMRKADEKMAELYEAKNKLDKALELWRGLLDKHPNDRKYMDQVCRLASSLGMHDVSLPVAQRLINLAPNNASYRTRLAEALLAAKRDKEALPHLEWLFKNKPNDIKLRETIAGLYEKLKKPAMALALYNRLIAHKPAPRREKLLEWRIARIHLYSDLKQEKRRGDELEALVRDYPKNLTVRRELASYYLDREQWAKAKTALEAVLALSKNDPQALAQLAKMKQAMEAASRRRTRERIEEERYQDWVIDLAQRAEDF